jgi:hypothetical protein
MHDQRIEDDQAEDRTSEEARDNAVLNRMFLDSPAYPWSMEEIARELQSRIAAEDSVGRLVEAGLAHRLDGFVWPSRAARRANEIDVGSV